MDFLQEQIKKLLDISDDNLITIPPNSEMGDYSTTIAFKKAKEKNENPTITALNILNDIYPNLKNTFFKTVRAYGPYINFFINKEKYSNKILKEILLKKENYGNKKKKKEIQVVEFPSPNTNKPLHIGHARVLSIGQSISNILETQGLNIKRVNLFNDRGIHICKSMLSYQKWGKNKTPEKLKEDHFIGKYYVMYEAKKTEKLEKELKEMLIKWENKDKETIKLWKKMNKWFYKGINKTLKKFKIDKFDKNYYESKFYLDGKKEALKLKNKGIAVVDENNAIYVDLEDEKLGRLYLLRGDGTTLYSTQDLILTKLKYADYKFSKSIMVIANEQKHYLKQLFSVFKKAKYTFANKCLHLGFGVVRLPEGKFSSRKGNAINLDELIDKMTKLTTLEVKKRNNKINEKICEKIAVSAIKYFLLKYNNNKDIIFNAEESISFEGNTGPYILYSLVRANKIIEKSNITNYKNTIKKIETNTEFDLIKKMAEFGRILEKVVRELNPSILSTYSFELSSLFNSFYENCPVNSCVDEKLKKTRLDIVKAFILIITKSIKLLGMEIIKKM